MSAPRPETLALLAEQNARREAEQAKRQLIANPMPSKPDWLMDVIDKAAPFMDAGEIPHGRYTPSQILRLAYCVGKCANDREARASGAARILARIIEGRKRWLAGFSADPISPDPVPCRPGRREELLGRVAT